MNDLKILQKTETLHEARWWEPEVNGRAHCYLCPRHCHINPGQAGFCFIRVNQGGALYSLGYGAPAALQVDPIEKKPLNHFLPGTRVFSMGTAGCNMGCFFCQNWNISKSRHDQVSSQPVPPEDVPLLALKYGCDSIAFTYNEPTIWGEYVIDICKAAKTHGLKTVMVSNGYITRDAFHDIYDHIDAANIDLKAFTENFYGKITLTHLGPVLDTLQWLKNETGVWFEITNLMIPGLNDDLAETRKLADWVLRNSARMCRCTSPRFIRISSCGTNHARRPRHFTRRDALRAKQGCAMYMKETFIATAQIPSARIAVNC